MSTTKALAANDPTSYAGYTRLEIELEVYPSLLLLHPQLPPITDPQTAQFVQCLANPWYLNYLATTKVFDEPTFIAYLDYLQYFSKPEYAKYLSYPAPTLKALELLQQERFRKDILMPETVGRMVEGGMRAGVGDQA